MEAVPPPGVAVRHHHATRPQPATRVRTPQGPGRGAGWPYAAPAGVDSARVPAVRRGPDVVVGRPPARRPDCRPGTEPASGVAGSARPLVAGGRVRSTLEGVPCARRAPTGFRSTPPGRTRAAVPACARADRTRPVPSARPADGPAAARGRCAVVAAAR